MIKFFLQRPKVNIDIKCIISINSTVLTTKWYICLQFSIKHNSLLIPTFFFLWPAYLMTFPLPVLTLMTSLWFFCTHSRLAAEDICIISTEQSEEHGTKMKKELLLLLPALIFFHTKPPVATNHTSALLRPYLLSQDALHVQTQGRVNNHVRHCFDLIEHFRLCVSNNMSHPTQAVYEMGCDMQWITVWMHKRCIVC